MERYRIIKIGFSYEVQRYGLVMLDGCPDYDWKAVATRDTEEEAKAVLDSMKRGV